MKSPHARADGAISIGGAPDYAESVEAWRVWRIVETDGGPRLASAFWPTVWPVREPLVASCLRRRSLLGWIRRAPRHAAPAAPCECGVYAASLEQVEQYLTGPPTHRGLARVLGRVSLWGDVVECERGYRASHAYPLELYVPADAVAGRGRTRDDLADGLRGYGVRVELLPARGRDAPRLLAREQL